MGAISRRELDRRQALKAALGLLLPAQVGAAASVSTLIGNGAPGHSDSQVNNPYGVVVGPDGALYFCDLDNQRIRRLDLGTRQTRDVAGNGQRAYAGDGGPATSGSLNMPHEIAFDARGHLYIAERDNHVVRKVDARPASSRRWRGRVSPASRVTKARRLGRNCGSRTALRLGRTDGC